MTLDFTTDPWLYTKFEFKHSEAILVMYRLIVFGP